MADRVVLQVDQAEPQSKNLSRHITECCADSDMDCALRLSLVGLLEIQGQARPFNAANS